jgi:hypothetical protein
MQLVLRCVCVHFTRTATFWTRAKMFLGKKLHKSLVIHLCFTKERSNSTNIYVKFYLKQGLQEPEIYIANIPGVRNMMK